jgi:hypothetical protein
VRVLPAGSEGFAADGDEDARPQRDRPDDEHLHVLPEVEREAIDTAAKVIFE